MNTVALRTALSARIGNNAPNVMTVTHCRTGCASTAAPITSATGRVRHVTNTAARTPNVTAKTRISTRQSVNAGWNAKTINTLTRLSLAKTARRGRLRRAGGSPIRRTAIRAKAFPSTAERVRNAKTVPAPKPNVKTATRSIRRKRLASPRARRAKAR